MISTVTLVVTVIEDGALRRISIMEYIGRGSLMASLIISPRMAAWVIIGYQFQLEKLLILQLYKSVLTLDCLDTHPPFLSLWGLGSQRLPFLKLFQGFHRNGMSFQVLLSHVSSSLALHDHGRILWWSESLPISLIASFV